MSTQTAHEAESVRAMQMVISSLLLLHNDYEAASERATALKQKLRNRDDPDHSDAAFFACAKETRIVLRKQLRGRKAHEAAFVRGLRNPAHSNPAVLLQYLADDGTKYAVLSGRFRYRLEKPLKLARPDSWVGNPGFDWLRRWLLRFLDEMRW